MVLFYFIMVAAFFGLNLYFQGQENGALTFSSSLTSPILLKSAIQAIGPAILAPAIVYLFSKKSKEIGLDAK